MPDPALALFVLPDIPLVTSDDDLTALLVSAVRKSGIEPRSGDIFAVAQKIVSKAEGRIVSLGEVEVTQQARQLADRTEKDPRAVQLILDESHRVVRERPGVIIVEHRLGLVLANAGIDRSNVAGDEDTVLLLPENPDASAAGLRAGLEAEFDVRLGVVITDSFGRPWRLGTTGVAIGAAGITTLDDRRGEADIFGRKMQVAEIAVADGIAAAAGLLMGEGAERSPAILIRYAGSGRPEVSEQTAADIIRAGDEDLFR